jgi:hypothetical protein
LEDYVQPMVFGQTWSITFCIFSPGKCCNHGQFCVYWFLFNRCWCRHTE